MAVSIHWGPLKGARVPLRGFGADRSQVYS